jgi:hypothetical protein
LEEYPSIEFRDWMQKDMTATLWESRPVFKKEKNEGDDVEYEKV